MFAIDARECSRPAESPGQGQDSPWIPGLVFRWSRVGGRIRACPRSSGRCGV